MPAVVLVIFMRFQEFWVVNVLRLVRRAIPSASIKPKMLPCDSTKTSSATYTSTKEGETWKRFDTTHLTIQLPQCASIKCSSRLRRHGYRYKNIVENLLWMPNQVSLCEYPNTIPARIVDMDSDDLHMFGRVFMPLGLRLKPRLCQIEPLHASHLQPSPSTQ